MITLTRTPFDCQAAGHPIQVAMESDFLIDSPATNAVYTITSLSSPTAGETIILTWPLGQTTFTFAASPDDSGNQLPVTTDTDDLSAAMALNYDLGDAFLVFSLTPGTITFSARNKGANYDLDNTGTATYTFTRITGGEDAVEQDNARFLLDIFMPDTVGGLLFSKVAALEGAPDTEGKCSFDIGAVLWDYLRPYRPEFGQNQVTGCPEYCITYYLRYAESYGIPAIKKAATATTPYETFAIRAKLDQSMLDQFSNDLDHFDNPGGSNLSLAKNGLTLQPVQKIVTPAQPEYLYYLLPGATIWYVALLVKWDNGTQTYHMPYYQAGDFKNQVICIPVGHDALNIAALAPSGAKCVSYKIKLYSDYRASVPYVEREYIITRECHRPQRYFLYLNSLGAYETLRTNSNFTKGVATEQPVLARSFVANTGEPFAEVFQEDGANTYTRRASTGYHNGEWLNHFAKEFMSAERRYELDMDNGTYLPIIVTTNSVEYERDKQINLRSFRFDYTYAFNSSRKSGLQIWPDDEVFGGNLNIRAIDGDWIFDGIDPVVSPTEKNTETEQNGIDYPDLLDTIGGDYPDYDYPTS
jgi:hypothetical protein